MASLETLDPSSPPFIPIAGVANLRDIGGYTTSSTSPPKLVRTGIFYRAADPCACPDASVRRLRDELGIATVYDLRAKPEIDRNAGDAGDVPAFEGRLAAASRSSGGNGEGKGGIKREWVPVFKEADYGPEAVALRFIDYASKGTEGFVRAYADIAGHGVAAYTTIFRRLASISPAAGGSSAANQGVLIHCTAGKDRTGVFVALLLSLLGVDDETIARKYTLTEIGLKDQKQQFIDRITMHPAFQAPDGPGREGAVRMTTCTDAKMLDTLKMFREKYGGAEGYVKGVLGLSDAEIDSIRDALTVDVTEPRPAL